MRTYELTLVVDPRLSDEQVDALCGEYRQMIESGGGHVEHLENWGKRKLAYPIHKLEEGHYFLFHISSENGNPAEEVEHRMRQNEDVFRFLTVRTEALDFDPNKGTASGDEDDSATPRRDDDDDDDDDRDDDDDDADDDDEEDES